MKASRNRTLVFALLALLVVFAGCKGESPTAPTPGGGTGNGNNGGGTTPPTGATITLTVSNANPLVNSTSVITATVTQNNNPVPNGTAVEFQTTLGTFQDTGLKTTLRTTTNGVATATLTSSAAGTATVTAIVNNVTKTTTVTFTATPVTPPPTSTAPTVTGVTPTSGLATGGQTLTITGTNFRTPVRVLFQFSDGTVKEGFVCATCVTPTSITVVTPAVNLGAGQTLDATVVVLTEAGTSNETRTTASGPFTFRAAQLTPVVSYVSPDSGPIDGGTRITIFGEGFEAPVAVSFRPSQGQGAWSAMTVISVTFNQIVAMTPKASDVLPGGSGTLTGPVDMRVRNINSNTEVISTQVFRYTPAMVINGFRPLQGSALGGTDVTIDGSGFNPPVDVFIGGILAQTIKVTGTQIIARTNALASPCGQGSGTVVVTNIDNGDSASAQAPYSFTYIGVNPVISSVTGGPFVPGSTVTAIVTNPGVGPLGTALTKFQVGSTNVTPNPQTITAGTGNQTFTLVVPTTGFQFPTIHCTTASATPGTQLGSINVDLTFNNVTTGCSNTLSNGLTINPPGPNTCLQPPTASTSAGPCPTGIAFGTVASGTTSAPQQFTISNAPNSQTLTLSAPAVTGTNATVTVIPTSATTVNGGASTAPYTVTVQPTAAGPFTGTITFTTNDPTKTSLQICVSGTGT